MSQIVNLIGKQPLNMSLPPCTISTIWILSTQKEKWNCLEFVGQWKIGWVAHSEDN